MRWKRRESSAATRCKSFRPARRCGRAGQRGFRAWTRRRFGRAVALGADFLVVHPGSRGESTPAQAISTIVESVKQASKHAPMGGLRILIENTAGMGSAMGARLEEVGEILAGLRNLPAGACLDTAHLFAAGYDIKSEEGLASTIGQIESTIGLENVPVFHVNDSKIDLGGRVDRNEHN